MKFKFFLLIGIFLSLCLDAENIKSNEYSLSPIQYGGQSSDTYYNSLLVPDLYVGTKCYKDCKKDCCYSTLENEKGEVLRSFSTSDSVNTIARSRYKNRSYLYYSRTSGSGKNRKTAYHLVDNKLHNYSVPSKVGGSFDSLITKDAKLVELTPNGLYINAKRHLEKMDFEAGVLNNNLNGDIAALAIDTNTDTLFCSNMRKWANTTIMLAKHSDRKGVLAVYPDDHNNVYAAAYNLINIYNKGLMGAHTDFNAMQTQSGWIYNDEKVNIGFYPQIYSNSSNLYVRAKNSSTDKNVYFVLSKERYSDINKTAPVREGFEDESMVDIMVGTGVSYLAWDAKSKVEKNDNTYADTQYDISNSLYKELYFQGRVGNTQLAVSYAQNEAQKKGGLTKKASQVLSSFVDFNSLVSDSSSLRISYTKAQVNGLTTFIDKNYAAINVTPYATPQEFTTEIQRIALLLMQEKGFYWGAEYTSFKTPAAVGFSDSSKSIGYYGLDKELGMQNYELIAGYDTAAYAKRYETDFSKFYFQGMGGVGASIYEISSELKNKVETTSSKTIRSSTYSLVLDLELEAGYIWQERFKSAKGLGYSIEIGAKARGMYTGIGQSDESDSKIGTNELEMEMSRYDIWFGPFANVNIVF